MASSKVRVFGTAALWLSFLAFALYFLNVLIGGPLGMKTWLNDLGEVLTLFLAVILFVAGAVSRESEANVRKREQSGSDDNQAQNT